MSPETLADGASIIASDDDACLLPAVSVAFLLFHFYFVT
jgi:hypothetical protein